MSDAEHRDRFEAWLSGELRRPVAVGADGPGRVMSRVRESARARRSSSARPAAGFAFAACIVSVLAFRMAVMLVPAVDSSRSASGDGLRDTISSLADSMQGTARLVSVAVVAPAAARIAIVHDYHGWDLQIAPAASRRVSMARRTALEIAPDLHLMPVAPPDLVDSMRASSSIDSMPERR